MRSCSEKSIPEVLSRIEDREKLGEENLSTLVPLFFEKDRGGERSLDANQTGHPVSIGRPEKEGKGWDRTREHFKVTPEGKYSA